MNCHGIGKYEEARQEHKLQGCRFIHKVSSKQRELADSIFHALVGRHNLGAHAGRMQDLSHALPPKLSACIGVHLRLKTRHDSTLQPGGNAPDLD
jgi:hypothetical protein